jgi:DNA polymerase III subunit epsilon
LSPELEQTLKEYMSSDQIDSKKLISELSFCVIDLETTGGNHDTDRIIEIGMVKVHNLKIIGQKNFLIDPEMPIPDFIQRLTSIRQKDVKGKPKIEEVIHEIVDFIGDDILVAHNTSFDVPFMNSVLRRQGIAELKNKVICTNVMTKHMIPDILNSNLNYMSQLFDIGHQNAHRASDDAYATAELLLKYLDIFIDKGIKKVNQLYYPRNKFELDRVHYEKSHSTKEEILTKIKNNQTSMMLIFKGAKGLILAVLPVESPLEEISFIEELLDTIDWELLTIRLSKPFLEGLFEFNNHFMKYPEEMRTKLLDYLNKRYKLETIPKDRTIGTLDFLICHHLVQDQVIVYSFLHLNPNAKAIFKIPAQKKKMLQYLTTQAGRFESHQKGRRKTMLLENVIPVVESYLTTRGSSDQFLFLYRKTLKESKDEVFNYLEQFIKHHNSDYHFPRQFL